MQELYISVQGAETCKSGSKRGLKDKNPGYSLQCDSLSFMIWKERKTRQSRSHIIELILIEATVSLFRQKSVQTVTFACIFNDESIIVLKYTNDIFDFYVKPYAGEIVYPFVSWDDKTTLELYIYSTNTIIRKVVREQIDWLYHQIAVRWRQNDNGKDMVSFIPLPLLPRCRPVLVNELQHIAHGVIAYVVLVSPLKDLKI